MIAKASYWPLCVTSSGGGTLIGATFDPHSHLSLRRTENADLITVFKEFPHTDFVEVAENLIDLMHQAAMGTITPLISTFDCGMIEVLPTSREPMRGFVDRIKAMEGKNGVLSVSVIHGFMAGGVPDLGARIIVITDNDRPKGDALAASLGAGFLPCVARPGRNFWPTPPPLTARGLQAWHRLSSPMSGTIRGGVPGGSTILLAEMLRRRIQNAALATIWDPIAVRTCFSAGEGATFRLRFGAKMSEHAGDPIDADVVVKRAVCGAAQSFGQSVVPLGDAVWIEVGGVDVILNSVRSQVFNPDVFSNFGIDPTAKKLLVVKSTNHFQDAFARISHGILYAAVDGPYPNNPETNDYHNLTREIWPRVETPHGG